MKLEVWSDVVCPWCYIGKRRMERALEQFEHADDVQVEWRSYQLDPTYPTGISEPVYEALGRKFGGDAAVRNMLDRVTAIGAEEDLKIDFDRALTVNTFDAHRLLHLAKETGVETAAWERLLKAYFVQGEDLSNKPTLIRALAEAGVPEADSTRVLESDAYKSDVEADIQAAQSLGANGVPFFVIDRRYGISGAQPVEVFLQALNRAHADTTGN
ncbi:Predicted dithiol-disulfide isomerase, DsbA family [Sinosporangium album]|uniref:Predicted dithiol-disulfide isomerase, DsbA family n=1 Tax=Sinosporangium album TaxID=504805 RepID=A0A1G8CQ15_9ACTN|nr:DsbA family oxidoreductase [Sinosporangium album]SDH47575.1 Predicted dithiol-disulfide isomerase, DsbA family [Sinosporangium album]